jgi:hypothetical protein
MGRQHIGDEGFGGEDLTCNSDDLQLSGMGKAAQCPDCGAQQRRLAGGGRTAEVDSGALHLH